MTKYIVKYESKNKGVGGRYKLKWRKRTLGDNKPTTPMGLATALKEAKFINAPSSRTYRKAKIYTTSGKLYKPRGLKSDLKQVYKGEKKFAKKTKKKFKRLSKEYPRQTLQKQMDDLLGW